MSGITSLLGIARDALAAQAFGLNVVGQNVANANTPGYVRRTALLQTRVLGTQSYGGVEAVGIQRAYDRFLEARALQTTSFASSASARDQGLGAIEAAFDDAAGTGLGTALNALFASFGDLAANPTDTTTRQSVLDRASDFVTRAHDAAGALDQSRQDLLLQATGVASEINDLLARLAKLNQTIVQAESTGGDAADLRDEQGRLLGDLAERIDIHTFQDANGQLVVQSSGTTLVENDIAATVSVSGTPGTAMQVLVSRQGGAPQDITQRISGGTLAGIRQARDTDAAALQTKLDQLVFDVATAINTQHALGVGLDSTSGRNLFTVAAPPGTAASVAIDPALVGRPDRVAAALAPGSLPGGSDNAAALAALVSANITGGNTRTAAQGWADLMGDVAQRKAAAASDAQVRDAMKAQVKSMRDSVSGVSLDEEMVNLTKYQRAYEATAKLIRLVDELLGDLMRTLK